jgi:hypothetical protein
MPPSPVSPSLVSGRTLLNRQRPYVRRVLGGSGVAIVLQRNGFNTARKEGKDERVRTVDLLIVERLLRTLFLGQFNAPEFGESTPGQDEGCPLLKLVGPGCWVGLLCEEGGKGEEGRVEEGRDGGGGGGEE